MVWHHKISIVLAVQNSQRQPDEYDDLFVGTVTEAFQRQNFIIVLAIRAHRRQLLVEVWLVIGIIGQQRRRFIPAHSNRYRWSR